MSRLLTDPAKLQAAVGETIEQEYPVLRGDLHEVQAWLQKLAELDRKRSRYQEMAAEGLIDFDELRAKQPPWRKLDG